MKWFFVPLIFISSAIAGQINQIWLDVNLQHKINNHWSWLGDAGARFTIQQSLSVAFARGGIIYTFTPHFELMGGVGIFFTTLHPRERPEMN